MILNQSVFPLIRVLSHRELCNISPDEVLFIPLDFSVSSREAGSAATCGPALREKSSGTVIVYRAGCRSQDTKTLFIRMQLHV